MKAAKPMVYCAAAAVMVAASGGCSDGDDDADDLPVTTEAAPSTTPTSPPTTTPATTESAASTTPAPAAASSSTDVTDPPDEPETTTTTEPTDDAESVSARIDTAEQVIDAFYSFDAAALDAIIGEAGGAANIKFYQGWAEGANYSIVERSCEAGERDTVVCPITVSDDLMKALEVDYDVTDTFTISFFSDTEVAGVRFSSEDQADFSEAMDWTFANRPEIFGGPCEGFFDDGPTPGDCARAFVEAFREFATTES